MEWRLSWPVRAAASVAALGIIGLLYGTLVEPHHLRLRQVSIDVPDLPAAFDGYRIVQLSDFHVGGRGWSAETIKRAVALAMVQRADLIVLTGDFFEYTPVIAACPELFGPLRAPDGVLAVLGNHDYHHHAVRTHRIVHALQDLGVRVLRNQSHRLRRGNEDLWIVGVDDPHSGHDDLLAAVAGVPPSARPLLLVHYPDFTWRLPPRRYALALTGHTHGSQVRLPLVGLYARRRIANTRFSRGLYNVNGTPVFVTTGVGTSGRRLRIGARPEVAVIRLRAGHPSGDR
jgi:predicted MPP superfamily phosphohydrolase